MSLIYQEKSGMNLTSRSYYKVMLTNPDMIHFAIVDLNKLADLLPHGSGIDSDYWIQVCKNGNIFFGSSFHLMNENGFYSGWADFKFKLYKHKKEVLHPLKGSSEGKFQVIHKKGDVELLGPMGIRENSLTYGLADQLYENVQWAIKELISELGTEIR